MPPASVVLSQTLAIVSMLWQVSMDLLLTVGAGVVFVGVLPGAGLNQHVVAIVAFAAGVVLAFEFTKALRIGRALGRRHGAKDKAAGIP